MPPVPDTDVVFQVNASVPGGLNASHFILVKNKTGMLTIEFSTETILETMDFNILVKERSTPISEANVWFNSEQFLTDSTGKVTLTAPDVLVTTTYGLIVNKTGYKSNSTMVTIKEADYGVQLMEVIYPSIVEPEMENIVIDIQDNTGGLEDVTLSVYYEGLQHSEYTTNQQGRTLISAPTINNDNFFSISIMKEGYSLFNGDNTIVISLFARDFSSDINININPSEVYEGETITVEVTDDVGTRIKDCIIWRGPYELDALTDSNGILNLYAPSVFFDREWYIYAFKIGYNYAEKKVTVRDKGPNQKKLNIDLGTLLNESTNFLLLVKDENNFPVEKATVFFNEEEKGTNTDGIVLLTTPNVTTDTFFTIQATKIDYIPASVSIQVLNINGNLNSRIMKIFTVPYILENEEFIVTIRNENGDVLPDARVSFMGTTLLTDYRGTVTFFSPDVNWNSAQKIIVIKSGFESISTEITIINNQGFEYWLLLIVIIIILIIGLFAYFKFGRFF
jgi:hypothetical protein